MNRSACCVSSRCVSASSISARAVHPRADVERVAVDRDGGAHRIHRLLAERRLLLCEVLDEARGLPGRVVELAVDDDRPFRDRQPLVTRLAAVRARVGCCEQTEQHEPAHVARRYRRSSISFSTAHAA
jgi:hypothetical protein